MFHSLQTTPPHLQSPPARFSRHLWIYGSRGSQQVSTVSCGKNGYDCPLPAVALSTLIVPKPFRGLDPWIAQLWSMRQIKKRQRKSQAYLVKIQYVSGNLKIFLVTLQPTPKWRSPFTTFGIYGDILVRTKACAHLKKVGMLLILIYNFCGWGEKIVP